MYRVLLVILAGTAIGWCSTVTGKISGEARVIDGDTIVIGQTHIRLFGIDAPELDQYCAQVKCGVAAREFLVRRLRKLPIFCRKKDRDIYGRLVAVCTVQGEDISEIMVLNGHAMNYAKFGGNYQSQQDWARELKLGLWADDQQPFMSPSRWRHYSR